jgi:hypothetical protein
MLEPTMSESETDTETELHDAIDGLYDAFARYPHPAAGGDRPLRELAADEVEKLAGELLTGTSPLAGFMHYLPRMLEIAVGEGFGWPDLEVVFGRLGYGPFVGAAPWTAWPGPERDAVRRFLHAFWRRRLATEGDVVDDVAGDALCAVGLVDPDIDWYLDTWLRFDDPAAAGNLQHFLILNASARGRGRLSDAFWAEDRPPAPDNLRRIVAWTKAPATKDAVAAAADRARTPAEREALEEVYLRWLD